MTLTVVVPRQSGPSGGRTYNEEVVAAWRRDGVTVDVLTVAGAWPQGTAADRDRLGEVLRRSGPVVLDGLLGGGCPEQVGRAVAAGTRVFLLVHLPLADETGLPPDRAEQLAALEARAARQATGIVATSRWAAADIGRRYRCPVQAVPPGGRRAPLATGSRPPHLLLVGSVTPRKNHQTALRALGSVAGLPWQASLVGPADDAAAAAQVRRVLTDQGLTDRVRLTGPLGGADLERCWQHADLLLLPSLAETFGLVVLEAIGHGVPAVVSSGTGAVEALHSGLPAAGAGGAADHSDHPADLLPGASADPHDPREWSALLRTWLTDPPTRHRWAQTALACRDRLRPWSQAADELRAVVEAP